MKILDFTSIVTAVGCGPSGKPYRQRRSTLFVITFEITTFRKQPQRSTLWQVRLISAGASKLIGSVGITHGASRKAIPLSSEHPTTEQNRKEMLKLQLAKAQRVAYDGNR